MLQLVAPDVGPGESEAGRTGGEVEVWAGNGGKEGGESCQCISIFTLQPRWLSHPVHPSAIPPSPHPSLLPESLCFQGNRLPCLPDDGAPPQPPPPPPHNLNRQCSDYHGVAATRGAWPREGEDVMWTEETERAGRRRMKAEGK